MKLVLMMMGILFVSLTAAAGETCKVKLDSTETEMTLTDSIYTYKAGGYIVWAIKSGESVKGIAISKRTGPDRAGPAYLVASTKTGDELFYKGDDGTSVSVICKSDAEE